MSYVSHVTLNVKESYALDEITDNLGQKALQPHKCPAKKEQQQPQPPIQRQQPSNNSNNHNLSSKEIAAIMVQLLVLVSRLDRIEAESADTS